MLFFAVSPQSLQIFTRCLLWFL